MNNKELETKIKSIITIDNMFDMIICAKNFEKEYKTSDFYKATKMSLNEVIKNAKVFYLINPNDIKDRIQTIINGLDLNSLDHLLEQIGQTFEKENQETLDVLNNLKDLKDIVK